VWLEGDGPLVEELEMLMILAASTTTVQFMGDFFRLLSQFVVVV
jgi:hypothetical protein